MLFVCSLRPASDVMPDVTWRWRHCCRLLVARLRQQHAGPGARILWAALVPVGRARGTRTACPALRRRVGAPALPWQLPVNHYRWAGWRPRRPWRHRASNVQCLFHRYQATAPPYYFQSRARRLHVDKQVGSRSGSGSRCRLWTTISTNV